MIHLLSSTDALFSLLVLVGLTGLTAGLYALATLQAPIAAQAPSGEPLEAEAPAPAASMALAA